VNRLGLNRASYAGERIDIDRVSQQISNAARLSGWTSCSVEARHGVHLEFYNRPAFLPSSNASSDGAIYISAGIHGDEPAGPLAMLTLLRENQWPGNFDLWICPVLNPSGFRLNTRGNDQGIDLNRDYRHAESAEVRVHLEWLQTLPNFDMGLCLHEDWEAGGYYCYELNPDNHASCAEAMIKAVSAVCPIETANLIDGRESDGSGIMRPSIDPAIREQWPEAFYLFQNKTRLSYTLEAPSDYALPTRIAALVQSVKAALSVKAKAVSRKKNG
jgi:hypothetical protein